MTIHPDLIAFFWIRSALLTMRLECALVQKGKLSVGS